MSDFLEDFERNFSRSPAPRPPDPDRNASLFEQAGSQFRQEREAAASVRSALNMNLSPEAFNFLMHGVDSGAIDEEELFRLATSHNIAERYGLPLSHVRGNLPVYLAAEGIDPNARMSQTVLRSVLNRLEIGRSTPRLGNMMYELMEAEDAGGDPDHARRLRAEIERIEARNASLEDAVPDGALTARDRAKRLLGAGAQTLGYSAYVMAHNLAGRAAGMGVVNFGPLFAWDAGRKIEAGQEYYALTKAGIDPDIARPLSEAHGVISAGVEQTLEHMLGLGAGGLANSIFGKKMSETLIGRLASQAFKSLQQNGFLYNLATAMGSWALNIPQEFGEEFLQEGDAILFESIARSMQQHRWEEQIAEIRGGRPDAELSGEEREAVRKIQELQEKLERPNWKENLGRMWEAGLEGGTAAIALGLPGAVAQTGISSADVARARKAATISPTKEQFRRDTEGLSIFRNIPAPENRAAAQDRVWENMRGIREREEARAAEEIKAAAGLGEGYAEQRTDPQTGEPIPLGETYYRKDGLLHTELDERRGLFKGGDPRIEGRSNLYFHFGYALDENGAVQINEFKVRSDLDTPGFRRKAFERFAEAFAGHDIAWDARTTREAEIREDLIRGNPYGEQAGLNYYSEADAGSIGGARYRNQVIDNFRRHFPQMGNAEHAVMAAEWEWFAERNGQSLEEYVDAEFGGLEKAFTTDPNRRIDAAMKEGKGVKGAVTFDGLARDAKAAVYLSRNADLTTFIHEMGHIYRRRLSGDMLAEAERLWGVTGGKWTTAQEERFAEDLERWRREGKAPSPEMRSFFEKFAEFLRKVINAVSQRGEVSPEIKEFFDKLYAGEGARNAQDGQAQAEIANDTAAGAEGRSEATTARYEVNTKLNEERPLLNKNADRSDPKPRQTGVATAQELRDKAAKHIDELRSWVNGIAKRHGARVIERKVDKDNPLPLKKLARIQEKIDDGDDVTEILDVLGMTIAVKDLQTLVKVTKELHGRDDVVRIKDRYKKADYFGYRDILANVQLSDGMIAEVQVNVEQMLAAKSEFDGHKYFEIARVLEKEVKAGRLTKEQQLADLDVLSRMSRLIYDKAYQAVLGESIFSASARDTIWPSLKDELNILNREGESVLSSFTKNMMVDLGLSANSSTTSSPSASMNFSDGSSKDGISTAGLDEAALSTGAAEAEPTESSFISVPSTTNITDGEESVNGIQNKNSPENEQRIEKARARWEAADRTVGAGDQITLQTGAEIRGHYELGEAGISTPSVDPDADFTQSEGFPVNGNGTSMNVGRDYTGGFSREAAVRMAAQFDQRGMGIVVDSNGVTGSGNNRDISRRIAARNGTDGKYVAYLKSRPERWGFTQEDVAKYRHPTLYFVAEAPAAYTPLYFDQFNRSGKKSVSPLETAIKMSYLVEPEMVNEFSAAMGNYDSVSELYEDTQAATEIFKSLMKKGIVTENSYPDYVEAMTVRGRQQERVTEGGKAFLESVMLGAVLNEDSIRSLALVPEIRKRVVKGLAALVDNAALGEYGVIAEINQAVAIAVEVQTNKKKYKGIEDYAGQSELELGQRVSTDIEVELAGRLLEKTEYGFADMMGGLNAVLREEAGGQSDIFGGTSKDDILRRYLGVKAKLDGVRAANNKIIESDTAPMAERVEAALGNAGLARGEADGTLFQAAYHGSPHRFDQFDSSHMGEGEGAQAYGWGHYFAGRKEVADHYRKILGVPEITVGDKVFKGNAKSARGFIDTDTGDVLEDGPTAYALATLEHEDGNIEAAKAAIRIAILNDKHSKELARLDRDALKILGKVTGYKSGQLYEADIPGDEEMLDWDKKLSEQPEQVKHVISKLLEWKTDQYKNTSKILNNNVYTIQRFRDGYGFQNNIIQGRWNALAEAQNAGKEYLLSNYSGALLYGALSSDMGSDQAASQYLGSQGIKGIRYLDGSSRAAGEGSHNYVIFGDSDIEITQTFFQLDGDLVAEAAQYDTWRDFRDAYEPMARLSRRRREDSVMPRQAATFAEAEEAGKTFAGKELANRETGRVATVSNKTLGKMLSVSASDKSVSPQVHALAVANIDHLYERAELLGSHDDEKNDTNVKQIHRFGVVMQHDGEFYPVKITVKEFTQTDDKSRIYTVEAVDVEKEKPAGQLTSSQEEPGRSVPIAGFTTKLIQMVDSVKNPPPIPSNADDAWYRSLWNDAQKIRGDTLFQDGEEKTSRAEELDKRWAREADKQYLGEALRELHRVHNDQSLEPAEDEGDAAHEEYRRVKRLQHRIRTELPNAGSIVGMAAQVNSGTGLSSRQYDRLKGWIRKSTRDYRAVLADIMGQEEYLEDLADTRDGEPAGRLADPRPDRQDIKARLKEIAGIVRESDPALAGEIEGGTVRYDDPRIAAFEAGVEAEYGKAKAALDELEQETAQDFARLANDAQRRIVAAYERVLEARGQMDGTSEKLRRMMDEERKIAEPYQRRQRLEKAGYDQAYRAYSDLVSLHGLDAGVREAIGRREAKAAEKARQEQLNRRRRAARALREMKLAHLKRITRRVRFGSVAPEQAIIVKAIQRLFLPSIIESGDRFVGTIDGPLLRQVWGYWQTDEEYRDKIQQAARTPARAEKLEALLEKPWDFLSRKEKQEIIKLLPKDTVASILDLRELAAEYKEDAQLDIEEKVVNGEAFLIVGAELEAKLKEAAGEETYRRIRHKPLAEWTPGELEDLARTVDRLTVEGRRELAAKREARRGIEQRYRDMVLDMIRTGGIEIKDDDTPEEKERKKKELAKIAKQGTKYQGGGKRNNLFNNFFDANLRRWTTAMDGGRKGVFTDLLYWMENDAYNKEQTRIAARRLLVETVMKEQGVRLDELYRKMEIPMFEASALFETSGKKLDQAARELGLPESTWSMDSYFGKAGIVKPDLQGTSFHDGTITVDELLYVMRGVKNEQTRKAIIYGNLSSARERAHYKRLGDNLDEIAAYENIGHYRLMRLLAFARDFFARPENKKFLALAEAIGEDFDRNGEILNQACLDMFDRPMWRVTDYVPMNRMEQSGEENQNLVIADMLGVSGAGFHWTPSGFKEKRIDMSPYDQAPIQLGLYRTWAKSVTDTEHFMAYGPVVQRLNAVFKGGNAAELREALHDRWGKASVERVDNTIAEFANPNARGNPTELDNIVRGLRGKTATAYLAWKTSGILKQMVTSPWPYLQEISPPEYIAACIEVAGGAGKVNDMIREKSIFMKNRDFDPMVKMVKEAMEKNDNAVLHGIDKFNALGMKGLEWVDWIWVAPGWLATYKRELANVAKEQEAEYQKLLKKYQGSEYSDVLPTMESRVNKALSEVLTGEQQDAEAVARADDAVRRMQPSSRSTDIAPLFKGKNELERALLQFQMALNVIWQNIRYDLPLAVKEKQIGTVVGMVVGYMAAGICLGLLSEIGNDDDDDEEGKLARRILFSSFTQFSDAVPVIGENVTWLAQALFTGKTSYSGQQNMMPVLGHGFGGAQYLVRAAQSEDPVKKRKWFLRAIQVMGEGAGIYFGLPTSGAKELGRAAGIGDGDGELGLYWQALLGQRKNK
jgi:hypothetical protein